MQKTKTHYSSNFCYFQLIDIEHRKIDFGKLAIEKSELGLCDGLGVGLDVGQPAFCACEPRHPRTLDRDRYLFPNAWPMPSVLDCDDGVFCVVEHAPHELHPFQHACEQPGSHAWPSLHAPAGWFVVVPEHCVWRARWRDVPCSRAPPPPL